MKEASATIRTSSHPLPRAALCIVGVYLAAGIILGTPGSSIAAADDRILYVQEGCAHCAKVEEFIEDNSLQDEVVIKDIAIDPAVSEEFTDKLDVLEVPLSDRGVPLLIYEDSKWLTGDTPIIDYLRLTFDIPEEAEPMSVADYALLIGGTVAIVAFIGYGIVNARHGSKKH